MRYVAALPELAQEREQPQVSLESEVTALFLEYRAPLFRFFLSLGLSAADAEEIIQETFLALCKHLRAGRSREHLRGWLFQVGHNQALKLRSRRTAPVLTQPPAVTPEEQAIENQTRRRLAAVIQALPEQERACLALRAEGLRYREIAEVLGISLGGVALALSRAAVRIGPIREGKR